MDRAGFVGDSADADHDVARVGRPGGDGRRIFAFDCRARSQRSGFLRQDFQRSSRQPPDTLASPASIGRSARHRSLAPAAARRSLACRERPRVRVRVSPLPQAAGTTEWSGQEVRAVRTCERHPFFSCHEAVHLSPPTDRTDPGATLAFYGLRNCVLREQHAGRKVERKWRGGWKIGPKTRGYLGQGAGACGAERGAAPCQANQKAVAVFVVVSSSVAALVMAMSSARMRGAEKASEQRRLRRLWRPEDSNNHEGYRILRVVADKEMSVLVRSAQLVKELALDLAHDFADRSSPMLEVSV